MGFFARFFSLARFSRVPFFSRSFFGTVNSILSALLIRSASVLPGTYGAGAGFISAPRNLQLTAAAIVLCLPPPYATSIDRALKELYYAATEEPLMQVIADLEAGTVASAVIRCSDERIRYASIFSPGFNKSGLSKWMGTIEVTVENWSFVWGALLTNPDLLFVCVGDPEGVELCDGQINSDDFPWTQWPLLIGAVRSEESREWVIRRRLQAGNGE